MKKLKHSLFAAITIYILFCATMFVLQRDMIYHGAPINKPTPDNVETITVTTEDGLTLQGWYIEAQPNAPVILHFHGNVGNVEWRYGKIMHYVGAGYNVLLAGYRSFGDNPGQPSEQGLYHDARAYLNWLTTDKAYAQNQIILYGESLGSGIATQMATEYNNQALILEAPYTSLPDAARQTYFFLPVNLLMKDQFRNIDKIHTINSPLLILHGNKDRVISVNQGISLYNAAQKPKTLWQNPDAAHNNLYDYDAPLHVLDFLRKIEAQDNQ